MSDEAVMGTAEDLSWDNIEDVAPSMEEGASSESTETGDEWDLLGGSEGDADEVKAEGSDEDPSNSAEDSGSKSEETGDESKEAVKAKEGEVDESNEIELPDNFKEMGLVAKEGELGKMIKVDGEETFVSLKDLGNDFSGQKAISQRFNEFDRKEKEFESSMSEVNEYITELGNTMKNESILGGVTKIGELVGLAPHQLKEALLRELVPEVERRYAMSEEEIALEQQRQENEYLTKQTESNSQRLKAEQAQRELDAKVYDLRETHNISGQEWKEYETALADHYKAEEITPELVVNYSNFKQAETRSESIINSFDSSYISDSEVMDALVEQVYDNPNLSDDDFREILESALGKTKTAEAENKVKAAVKAKEKTNPKPKEEDFGFKPPTSDEGEEIIDWDDIL